jgi:hypothetical protein
MGGFTLIGPTYIINSIPGRLHSQTGFKGNIPLDVEDILVNQSNKCLDLSVLPEDIREGMKNSNLGDNLNYKITKHLTQDEQKAKNKQWLSDIVDDRNKLYSQITYTNNTSSMFKEMFETLSVDNQQTTEAKLENLIEERNKVYKH